MEERKASEADTHEEMSSSTSSPPSASDEGLAASSDASQSIPDLSGESNPKTEDIQGSVNGGAAITASPAETEATLALEQQVSLFHSQLLELQSLCQSLLPTLRGLADDSQYTVILQEAQQKHQEARNRVEEERRRLDQLLQLQTSLM